MTITQNRRQAARVLTEAGTPFIALVLLPVAVAIHGAASVPAGLVWGAAAAFFFGVLPYVYVRRGVQQGRWADHHIGIREHRKPVLLVTLASMLAGLTLMAVLDAPRELLALLVILLVQAGLSFAVTLVWKVSQHSWVLGIAAVVLVLVFGSAGLLLFPVLAAVGWSRVELRDHTPAQVTVGALLGVLLTLLMFPALR